ncbi:MAG: formate dehydrogenase accessory sulfurtransferase FdhD [Verrucomicrobiota bacterium]|nr:formate dehydrogenase accessory sulfurtransferase FdhD [Verrucomicrobiota bacterium]MDP7048119.1 formate dehydrogenase accessory sulfurtransferase FdhD [Verrucomicrobiota bacterium]
MPSDTNQPSDPRASATRIMRWKQDSPAQAAEDSVAREEPLEIRVRGESVAVTMRTPGHDEELLLGFLLSEGVIAGPGDVLEVAPCQQGEAALHGNVLNVFLAPKAGVDLAKLRRNVYASSSCGLCGKASIESVHGHFPPLAKPKPLAAAETLLQLPARLRAGQETFDKTGGLHAAGVFDADGKLLTLREDVGRHNAVDKALGRSMLDGDFPLEARVLMVSGRASFEILQKALAGRVPVVCAVSAPSSLAVDFAQESGQTLIGFLRGNTFNVYSHSERITGLGG